MSPDIRNVVVVVVDALRRDRVGAYHDDETSTPHIDELAAAGTVFENAFSCSNTTDPSITSIHTGRDPETVVKHHGPFVTDEEKRRAESVKTVPEQLRRAGLWTAVTGRTLGRWHSRGFDHYPEESLGRYRRRALGQRLGAVSPRLRRIAGSVYEWLSSSLSSGSSNEVERFVESLTPKPFYGLIHLMETHVPYSYDEAVVSDLLETREYPNEDLETFLERHSDNPYVDETMREHAEAEDYRVGLARWFAKYDAAVVNADRKVGRLVELLDERDRLEDTAIILLSDHGESLDEHGIYFEHHGLYEPQIRVPLVVAGPAIPDRTRSELVQLYDLAPTILDLLDVERAFPCDGRSLVPLLAGQNGWERQAVVVQEAHAQCRIGIRTARYKYLKHVPDDVLDRERGDSFRCGYCDTVHGDERELYDLHRDPQEETNLVDERPEQAAELDEQLMTYFDGLAYPDATAGQVTYDEETKVLDRLEDLGYR